ncbi:hypothetical protein Tco_1464116, partial [Tanacetum coccineum]
QTIDRFFELVGYPPGFKRKDVNQSVNNVIPNKVDQSKGINHIFTTYQYQRLMNLLSGLGESSNVQANVAGSNSKVPDED